MLYILVTTSIYNSCEIRKSQYINCITKIKEVFEQLQNDIPNKIIVIENNGPRKTYLDDLGCDVYYTNNNFINTQNKGIKEIVDIFYTIKKYNIQDDDFIVKITGRYLLMDNSPFIESLKKNINLSDCIIKYSSYIKPDIYDKNDSVTGLIGMRTKYVKMIEYPRNNECIEWKWAKSSHNIEENRIISIDKLGINICPGSNTYFSI